MKNHDSKFKWKKVSELIYDEYCSFMREISGIGKNDGEGPFREIEEEPHFSNKDANLTFSNKIGIFLAHSLKKNQN